MSEARQVLARSRIIAVIDWPSRDVPETLARAGFTVLVKGGPGPADFTAWELAGGEVRQRPLGRAPERADLVYAHRPASELPAVIRLAQSLGAAAVWRQSGLAGPGESAEGTALAAAAGLGYLDSEYIADVARSLDHGE